MFGNEILSSERSESPDRASEAGATFHANAASMAFGRA
jgi:hypothetical protein